MVRFAALLMIVTVLVAGAASAQEGTSGQPVTLFVTFVPNVQFSPVYVAERRGHFAEQGLSVSFEHGDEPVGVDLIATGERDFGLISGEQVLAARANGRPVVSVYEWFQQFPVGIVYAQGTGIDTVQDLRQRNVGIPGRFGASYSGLTALLAANDMTEQDIDLEEIGFNAPEVFCLGGVEASVIYVNNEPLQIARLAQAGQCGDVTAVGVFAVADAVDMVSNGLITTEAKIAREPALVEAMVRAFDAGLREAIQNPAQTYLISAEFVEGLPLSAGLRRALENAALEQSLYLSDHPEADRGALADRRDTLWSDLQAEFSPEELVQFQVLLTTITLWDADRLGYADAESWAETQDVLLNMGYISEPVDVSEAFTNQFLPE
jgi:NitT/TauT family transport system substrate-binding protein